MDRPVNREVYAELLTHYQPTIIESEEKYNEMIAAAEELMAKEKSPEAVEILKLLAVIIGVYESNVCIVANLPHENLKHLMESNHLKQKDLVGIIGSTGVVSDLMNGKRSISKTQAKALGDVFHVSPALFI